MSISVSKGITIMIIAVLGVLVSREPNAHYFIWAIVGLIIENIVVAYGRMVSEHVVQPSLLYLRLHDRSLLSLPF